MSGQPRTVADALDRSMALLKEHGWTRDTYICQETGAMCAVAAIHVAACNCPANDELENLDLAKRTCTDVFRRTVAHLSNTLIERTDLADGDIIEWNDDSHIDIDGILEIFGQTQEEARGWLE